MLAALNLPKWLLVAVAFCIVIGHLEQVNCRLQGCGAVTANCAEKAPAKNSFPSDGKSDGCGCACHFGTVALSESPPSFFVLRVARDVEHVERYDHAPEVPCAEIEYPPRASRA